ncbi:chaperone protein ClpB [Spirochaetia bacterium]|nr:chaperone protein ClpB [Spirochaetia bacterium]
MFRGLTQRAQHILTFDAQEEARRFSAEQLLPEHIIIAILREGRGIACEALLFLRIDLGGFRWSLEKELPRHSEVIMFRDIPPAKRTRSMLETAAEEARLLGNEYIGTEHLLFAAIQEQVSPVQAYLNQRAVDREMLREVVQQNFSHGEFSRKEEDELSAGGFQPYFLPQDAVKTDAYKGVKGDKSAPSRAKPINFGSLTPTLDEYARDLTALAKNGSLDPVVGRQKEINRAIRILARRTKNNPILVGEPGVGKTAIVEGLAQLFVGDDVPEALRGRRILSLDLGSMVAGTKYRGEFEERLKRTMKEIAQARNVILFIDEIHTVIGAGSAEGTIDAANMLKPALSRGDIQCIGATTLGEYRKYFEKDAALERRFQSLIVEEPGPDETVAILKGLQRRYEDHHRVRYTDDAVHTAVRLTHRYVTGRFMPDKAIDVLDEAGAMRKLEFNAAPPEERTQVGEGDIRQIVSEITGIPLTHLEEQESRKLLKMEEELHKRVIGQEDAVRRIASSVRRSRAGISSPRRPMGSFIFLGPTGVGKTLLAKGLAEYLFGSEDALIRIDMSDYMEKHNVSRLVGAPPGYVGYEEGGVLTEQIRRNPYRVILFDEIEKAHHDVFNLLLQVLEEGELKDNLGHTVNFRNTAIIMTSNAGVREISRDSRLGFGAGAGIMGIEEIRSAAMTELRRLFNPEFLNRVDDVVVFNVLNETQVEAILDIQVGELSRRLAERGFGLRIGPTARRILIEKGWDPKYGGRPMRRTIQQELEDPLSLLILEGGYPTGTVFVADTADGKIRLAPDRTVPEGASLASVLDEGRPVAMVH